MAGMRLLGSSNVDVFLQSGNNFVPSLEALVAAGSCGFLHGPGNAITQPFYQTMEFAGETCNIDLDEALQHPEKKRRLTADQLQLLEQSFESENKLEPERKVQLAKELGLQPRQVAIWFQNRRARWKTKHLEKEYEALKSSYDTLKLDHDNLLKECEELQAKVLSLTNMLLEKEKDNDRMEFVERNIFSDKLQKLDSDADNEIKKLDTSSSATSTVLDSERPTFSDGIRNFSAHESEISHVGEADEVKVCEFVAPENILCYYELQDGDQALWIWPSI